MKYNPLTDAIDIHNSLMQIEADMMEAVGGREVFEPFDDELCTAVIELIENSSNAISELSHRAGHARINLIWKDFVIEQRKLREPK